MPEASAAGRAGEAKTDGKRDGSPKSMIIRNECNLLKSNVERIKENAEEIEAAMAGRGKGQPIGRGEEQRGGVQHSGVRRGGGWTMAGLEAVLRERLGLAWMRRAGRRRVA